MKHSFEDHWQRQCAALRQEGLYKEEREIAGPQGGVIQTRDREVINLCANNYLGLANHPELIAAAQSALSEYGYGMSSVRFICGTATIHKELENRVSEFLGMEDTILYSSCFDANTGLFETLLGPEDAIISDRLNHASIIDGIRLCKAERRRYENCDMEDLRRQLTAVSSARFKMIATDGVFSMDGTIAPLAQICDLAEEFGAVVMVDDSHAVGFVGENGRGTPELCGVQDRVDIVTGTLGKALGGASGGYVSAKSNIVEWLRQRSRPYLFSNTLAPVITATSLRVLEMLSGSNERKAQLEENTRFFRTRMSELGFKLVPGEHPIIPVMIGEAALATRFADQLLAEGVYVIGFSFPVVPKGAARIRTQMSAAHDPKQLQQAIDAFGKVGKTLGVIA